MTLNQFTIPEFTTAQLLSCVPGLFAQTFRGWSHRGVLVLLDAVRVGTGKTQLFSARDVIQAATLHELSRLNLPGVKAAVVWHAVQGRLMERIDPPAGESFRISAAFSTDPATGEVVMRTFREDAAGTDLLGLHHADVPDAFVVLRMDWMIARVLQRVNAVRAGDPFPQKPARSD